jgi:murein DD-endopeptidase MepM/ murein hydrolase activator NlpD
MIINKSNHPLKSLKYSIICSIIILMFYSGRINDVSTTGKCIIRYGNGDSVNSIETLNDGMADYEIDGKFLHILPDSMVDLSGDEIVLNNGIMIYGKSKFSGEPIRTKMLFNNEYGSCQFFRIGIPSSLENITNDSKIIYNLTDKQFDLNVKLHPIFKSEDKNISYYGFFVPYFPSWKIQNIMIDISISSLNSTCRIKNVFSIKLKEWEKQTVMFEKNKSIQLKNIDPKKYESEWKYRAKIFEENNPSDYLKNEFSYPLKSADPISSEFGFIREWILSNKKIYSVDVHLGVDIAKLKNTEVYASADGIVRYATYAEYIGNAIIIEHGMSLFSEYCHLNRIIVKDGDAVKKGDLIGLVGMTGAATGPHLHWETRVYNIPVDPRSFLEIADIYRE